MEKIKLDLDAVFQMIFKNYPYGIAFKDKDFKYINVNDAFCNALGVNRNELIGKNIPLSICSKKTNLINDVNESIYADGQGRSYVIDLEGKGKFLSITSSPIVYEGDFCGIISVVKDITYEENVKEQFVLKHCQLKTLLENIPMLVYLQDEKLNYIVGTQKSKDLIKKRDDINLEINIVNNSNDEKDSLDVIKENKPKTFERNFRDRKGIFHWYKIHKIPISDYNKKVTGLITLAQNIDAEKQLQNQRETFVATLGHDLKNPTIAQIRGLELLLKGTFGDFSQEQKEILEMVLDSCRYMQGMLSSLLATYKLSNGCIELHYEEFIFSDLVAECVSEMLYVAKDKEVRLEIDNNLTNLVIADRIQIKRVIMNLLSNGIKYAYKNTDMKLSARLAGEEIFFEFENRSPYIPTEKQNSIFARYVSYASIYKEIGVGLGLYASKKIIEAHNGNIYVKSFKDNRNIFGFSIPVNQDINSNKKIYF